MSTRRMLLLALALVVVPLVLPALAAAQTTGTLFGTVSSDADAVMPGVTVEVTSPALQGTRTTVSDGTGVYRLPFLPPGAYHVTFTLEGFAKEQADVQVSLGRDTTLDVKIRPQTAAEITVVATAPVIDTTSTTVGANLTTREIQTLPTGRNYASVVQVAPGTGTDAVPNPAAENTITVYGSSGAENVYYVDGVNTTNLEYGFQGKELNFEFIQEIDVKTGGYEAEYGKATGGVINVITKSGGNELHGDVFGYHDDDSLQNSSKEIVGTTGRTTGFTKEDFGADLGGYILRDRLWFFGAYDRVDNSTDRVLDAGPQAGSGATSKSKRDLGAGKLTYRLSDSQSLVGSYLQDPRTDTGAINDANHTLNGEPSTFLGEQKLGGHDYALRYDGVFGTDWSASAQVARHSEENSVGPATTAGNGVQFLDSAQDNLQIGGFGLIQTKDFERKFYGASASRFFGATELKGGVEYEDETADVSKRMSGGQQVTILENPAGGPPIYRHFYWTTPTATPGNAPLSALAASPEHKVTTAYFQTRWAATANFTLNLGVRWDRQEIFDAGGVEQINLDKDYAPRLGFVWTPSGGPTDKLYASFGRYYEQIPMDLVIRSFSYERQPRIFNYSPTSIVPDAQAEADIGTDSAILGGFTEPSDPDLENQYLEETILGYDREVAADLAVGIKGIYRNYGQVIEDFLCANETNFLDGTYCIGNPGEGIMRQVGGLDYESVFNAPKAKRTFKGVQLDVTKRLSNNWQGLASYLYSKLDGNFDGLYAPFTNVGADPNISAAYDYYDFFTNGSDLSRVTNTGDLSNDRRHQFKVSGVWYTPWKLEVGAAAYYRTGTPRTRYGFSDAYGRYEFFLTKRGAEGRMPDTYEADVHLGYPLAVGPVTINFLADVFNLLDAQRPVLLDQRWGFQEADNAALTPVNRGYGKAVLRTPPRSLRLGARISF